MSASDEPWVSAPQYRGIHAGLRIVSAWAGAPFQPEEALDLALRQEQDPTEVVVGLATVARLLALELGAATGRSDLVVLEHLAATVDRLQGAGLRCAGPQHGGPRRGDIPGCGDIPGRGDAQKRQVS